MNTPKVWGIPCPGGPDDEENDRAYRLWFWLYQTNQTTRHRLGLHQKPTGHSISPRCDWCGHRSAEQKAIAAANRRAMTTPGESA